MSSKKATKPADSNGPEFESALKELEALVESLESGELSLSDSLQRFKRGVELSKHCHDMLDRARQSVEILTRPEDEQSAEPFDSPPN